MFYADDRLEMRSCATGKIVLDIQALSGEKIYSACFIAEKDNCQGELVIVYGSENDIHYLKAHVKFPKGRRSFVV